MDAEQDRDLASAVVRTEQIRRTSEGWNSTEEIRRWRDERSRP